MGLREQALLAKVSRHHPSFRARDKRSQENIELQEGARAGTVGVTKKLFHGVCKSLLDGFNNALEQHRKMTIPFTLTEGLALLSVEKYEQHRTAMKAAGDIIESAKRELIDNRDMLIERDKHLLGNLFNIDDYPSQEDLEGICLEVVYMPVPQTNFFVEVEATEKKRLEDEFAKTMDNCITEVKVTTYKKVSDSLNDLCRGILDFDGKGDGRSLKENLVNNLKELKEQLPGINVLNDPIIDEAAKSLDTVTQHSAETLRSSKILRDDTRREAERIADRLKGLI